MRSPINKVVFLGSKSLGLQALKAIYKIRAEALFAIVTIDDTADTRSDLAGFREFSCETKIPIHIAKNSRDAEAIVRSLKPELCLVVCWYWLLKQSLLDSIPHGAIGVHNSLLPKYRGGSPLVWSILNGDKEIGFSIFSLTEEMDAGPIWFQERINLADCMNVSDALRSIEIRLMETFRSGWCSLLDGKISPKNQDSSAATYCAQRIAEDGKINWSQTAKQVVDFIRAQCAPYPGAFIIFNNQKIIIHKAVKWDASFFGTPGQVAKIDDEGVLIICGDNNAVLIKSVELDGSWQQAKEVFSTIKSRL